MGHCVPHLETWWIWCRSRPFSRSRAFGFGPALFRDLLNLFLVPSYFEILCIRFRSLPISRFGAFGLAPDLFRDLCVFFSVLPHFKICWNNWCLFGIVLALFGWPIERIQGSWCYLQGFRQPLLKTFTCFVCLVFHVYVKKTVLSRRNQKDMNMHIVRIGLTDDGTKAFSI